MSESISETRQGIIAEALTWEGTPWHHLQRCKGAGVDCAQFLAGVALAQGLLTLEQVQSVGYYSRQWNVHRNEEKLINTLVRLRFTETPLEDKLPGDVVVFQYARVSAHAGIYLGENRVIHAPMQWGGMRGKVRIERLDMELGRRLRKAFCFPGVESSD